DRKREVIGSPEEAVGEDSAYGLGIPAKAMKEARKKAEQRNKDVLGRGAPQPLSMVKVKEPGLVAIYAALAIEPTIECRLPPDTSDGKVHGLLTYTLCQELFQANGPMTYRELLHRIYLQYLKWGRHNPTPLVEGKDSNRFVLGEDKLAARVL